MLDTWLKVISKLYFERGHCIYVLSLQLITGIVSIQFFNLQVYELLELLLLFFSFIYIYINNCLLLIKWMY